MSTEKEVFKYLFKGEEKIELATQKIELGSIDDFEQISKNVFKNSDKAFQEADNSSKKISSFIDEAISLISKSENIFSLIEKQSKEIGFKLPSNLKQIKNDNEKELSSLKKLRKAVSTIRSIN